MERTLFGPAGPFERSAIRSLRGVSMKLTLSIIKADIGSVGGHVAPSRKLMETVESFIRDKGRD